METKQKSGFFETFKIWFGIGALMFGTYCGANMASGVYATTYMVTFGGGRMWISLAIFVAFMSFFCAVALDFIRAYKVDNYNAYYLALWGVDKKDSSPVLKTVVSVFFDVYTTLMGVVTVAATIALFANLLNVLLGVPMVWGSLIALVMFTFLSMYGAAFLRRFNSAMTIALTIALGIILVYVIAMRGNVIAQRLFNFEEGREWSGGSFKDHISMVVAYCFTTASWGGALSNYSEKIRSKKDAVGTGVLIGVMVGSLFLFTSLIVLPFLPEVFVATPILTVCRTYLPVFLTAVYWIVVMFSVISTGPTFIFNTSNRFVKIWKTDKLSHRAKLFIIAMGFLLLCLALSQIGLIAICQKGYTALGKVAIFAIAAPMLVSIWRVRRRDKQDRLKEK